MTLHIVKVAAGIATLNRLEEIVAQYSYDDPDLGPIMPMSSRNRPQRPEVLEGGSVYWIIKGKIVARAHIVAIRDDERPDGRKGCQICITPKVIHTVPFLKRGFQGWRYLKPEDAPADLITGDSETGKGSADLANELQALGLL